jgi:hypothetical protein
VGIGTRHRCLLDMLRIADLEREANVVFGSMGMAQRGPLELGARNGHLSAQGK